MALIDCGECGRRISEKAATCPGCGAPVVPPATLPEVLGGKPVPAARMVGLLTLGTFAVLALLWLIGQSGTPVVVRTPPVAATPSAPAAAPAPTADEMLAYFREAYDEGYWSSAITRGRALEARYPESEEAKSVAEQINQAEKNIEAGRLAGLWSYAETDDDMSSGKVRTAVIRSKNEVELGFPYQGKQRATLTLRRHPRHGNDVILKIERGQIMCSLYNCKATVRFDHGQARQFGGNPSSTHDSSVIFIKQYQSFMSGLRGAEIVRIQPEIYQHGGIVFEFETGGFDAAKF